MTLHISRLAWTPFHMVLLHVSACRLHTHLTDNLHAGSSSDIATALADARSQASAASAAATAAQNAGVSAGVVQAAAQASAFATTIAQVKMAVCSGDLQGHECTAASDCHMLQAVVSETAWGRMSWLGCGAVLN